MPTWTLILYHKISIFHYIWFNIYLHVFHWPTGQDLFKGLFTIFVVVNVNLMHCRCQTPEGEKKSREQLEAEKKAILKQRIQPLDTAGFDASKMAEKARELHNQLHRLESEKYDLERRFKAQLGDVSTTLFGSNCLKKTHDWITTLIGFNCLKIRDSVKYNAHWFKWCLYNTFWAHDDVILH